MGCIPRPPAALSPAPLGIIASGAHSRVKSARAVITAAAWLCRLRPRGPAYYLTRRKAVKHGTVLTA